VTLRRAEKCLGYETEGGCITRIQDIKEGEVVLGVRAIPPSARILPAPSSAALRSFGEVLDEPVEPVGFSWLEV
jgi:hypothetical protein